MKNLCLKARVSKVLFKNLSKIFRTKYTKVEFEIEQVLNEVRESELFVPKFFGDCDNIAESNPPMMIDTYSYHSFEHDYGYGIGPVEVITDEYKKTSLSKSAIKQFLLYHFIPSNKSLVRKGVAFSEIAAFCGVSVPCAKANHKTLIELGFIHSTPAGRGKVDIVIDQEYKLHNEKEKGGRGYLTLSLDLLKHLMAFNSINELKVELEKIHRADAKKSKVKLKKGDDIKNTEKNVTIAFNQDNLTKNLPDYVKKSKELLNKVLNSERTLFGIEKGKLNISAYEHQTDLHNRLKNDVWEKIEQIFETKQCSYSKACSQLVDKIEYQSSLGYDVDSLVMELENTKAFIINDISDLALQYGLDYTTLALVEMLDNNCTIDKDKNININTIKNPGAYLRNTINNLINRKGSLMVA